MRPVDVLCAAFSVDGSRIISGIRPSSAFVGRRTGTETTKGFADRDGNNIVCGNSPRTVFAYSEALKVRVRCGNVRRYRGGEVLRLGGHGGEVSGVAVRTTVLTVLSGSWDHSIRVWTLARQRRAIELEKESPLRRLHFSPKPGDVSSLKVLGKVGVCRHLRRCGGGGWKNVAPAEAASIHC